jgi:hypothetical protein
MNRSGKAAVQGGLAGITFGPVVRQLLHDGLALFGFVVSGVVCGTACLSALRATRVTNTVTTIVAARPSQKNSLPAAPFSTL